MISIIVSTYKPEKYTSFAKDVKNTIGDTAYEIIKIDNPGIMGICEAYNRGAEKAQYPYICFSHDDIAFKTKDWGQVLISIFEKNANLGLVGCAGCTYKPWIPSGWSSPQKSEFVKLNLIQTNKQNRSIEFISVNMMQQLEPVASLDGCWFCTKKEITNKYKFDEQTFKSYHCYDIDFSLQLNSKYQIAVTNDILVVHLSTGDFSSDWLEETYKLHRKWSQNLPISIGHISDQDKKDQETKAYFFL
ncbi:MAG: hypothetical protein RL662_2322, partial [Bacteroidota bacterium]